MNQSSTIILCILCQKLCICESSQLFYNAVNGSRFQKTYESVKFRIVVFLTYTGISNENVKEREYTSKIQISSCVDFTDMSRRHCRCLFAFGFDYMKLIILISIEWTDTSRVYSCQPKRQVQIIEWNQDYMFRIPSAVRIQ